MEIKAYSYSCLMAVLPADISARIRAFSLAIPDSDIYEIDDEEYGRPDEMHITVKYGLHTSDPDAIESVLATQDMVSATLGRIDAFHNEDCVVLKIGIESESITKLNGFISTEMMCTDIHPEYEPHVTVAYLRHREEDPYYYQKYFCGMFEGTEVWFDRLRFSTPDGDKYWVPLVGGFGQPFVLAARMRRMAQRIS